MKVLHVAGGLPTPERPFYQPFIKSQIDSLIKANLDVEVFDLKAYESSLRYFTYSNRLKNIVKARKIDIIHAHYGYCGLTSSLAKTGKPIILSLMGSDLLGSPDENGKIRIRGKFDILLTKFVLNFVDEIIVKSYDMKNRLKVNKPVHVLPNGVDFEIFKPMNKNECRNELKLPQDKFLVLFLGNINLRRKNFPLAKESVEKLKSKLGDDKAEIITPFGISHREVVKYYNACDVLLVPSFLEGSPNVVKEAMACNLPVISTDVGDVKEIISGARNCFIVPFSSEIIQEKLECIYKNNSRSNGRERIEHLKDNVIANKLITIYRNLLNNN